MTKFSKNPKYDLEEKFGKFGEKIIDLVKKVPNNNIAVSMHWLRMLARARETVKDECRMLWQET